MAVYPRVCGDPYRGSERADQYRGLPPRMRGSPSPDAHVLGDARSTPAYAGIPGQALSVRNRAGVYPRVCGDPSPGSASISSVPGLPPRMRGSLDGVRRGRDRRGSTPAYAGIPPVQRLRSRIRPVYPRVCGDPRVVMAPMDKRFGLPPRMRGSRTRPHRIDLQLRSTPAYAGIPERTVGQSGPPPVYPRVCGDPTLPVAPADLAMGLPPRMRGSQQFEQPQPRRARSTPAYAGIPGIPAAPGRRAGVYPRVCGDPRRSRIWKPSNGGLPPRMRGSQLADLVRHPRPGSTPAYAGIPPSRGCRPRRSPVYPRVCGDPRSLKTCPSTVLGLPPRMRGSRTGAADRSETDRSTPAYAGIPPSSPSSETSTWVYPRVCGDPDQYEYTASYHDGLPPRMRGSRRRCTPRGRAGRSTPAYAGIPAPRRSRSTNRTVYPRVCGDPATCSRCSPPESGLPPRMRGSLFPTTTTLPSSYKIRKIATGFIRAFSHPRSPLESTSKRAIPHAP